MSGYLHLIGEMNGEEMSGLARSAAGALVSGVWQGIALCATAGLILKLVPKTTATLRFIVWAAVFVVSVAMPFVNLPGAELYGKASTQTMSHVILGLAWSYILAGLWIVAACYRLGQLAIQGLGLRTLWSSAVSVAPEALAQLDVPLLVDGRRIELCTSDDVDRPSVIGFLAPKILIPAWLFEQLTAVELNHIVLHELEHLRRRDDWVNLLQKVGLVLLPLNPALFWIDRRLSTERELACDDGVLERTKMPRTYAASLASIAERRLDVRRHGRFVALALAATGLRRRRSELGARIESILGSRMPVNRAFASSMAGVLVAGVAGAGFGLAHVPQLVSFGPAAVSQQAMIHPITIMPREAASPGVKNSHVAPDANFATARFPLPRFQDVSLRESTKIRLKDEKTAVRKPVTAPGVHQAAQKVETAPEQRLVVLTSLDESSPVSRVAVQTPDGRFFLTPYAAVPTQAGWLLVQL